jgi:hypothetical protein
VRFEGDLLKAFTRFSGDLHACMYALAFLLLGVSKACQQLVSMSAASKPCQQAWMQAQAFLPLVASKACQLLVKHVSRPGCTR